MASKKNKDIFRELSSPLLGQAVDEARNSSKNDSSVNSSPDSDVSELAMPSFIPLNKVQKMMLMRMMKRLFKILYQSPEITEMRNRLKQIKSIRTIIVNVGPRPSWTQT